MTRLGRILPRVAPLLGTLVLVSALVSLSLSVIPGDPARELLGASKANPVAVAQVRSQLKLDEPVWDRYGQWVSHAVRGDLGRSIINHRSVTSEIGERLPVTIELMILSQLIALLLAVPAAMLSAQRPNRGTDQALTAASLSLLSVPSFVLGVALATIFADRLHLLPSSGFTHLTDDPVGNLRTTFLPACALAAGSVGLYHRVLRRDLIETLSQDYITLARARGMTPAQILTRHALRPASLSLVTVIGLNTAGLLGGTVVIENLFALPGVGRLMIEAISSRDYITVQGLTAFIALGWIATNLAVDAINTLLDPRSRRRASVA